MVVLAIVRKRKWLWLALKPLLVLTTDAPMCKELRECVEDLQRTSCLGIDGSTVSNWLCLTSLEGTSCTIDYLSSGAKFYYKTSPSTSRKLHFFRWVDSRSNFAGLTSLDKLNWLNTSYRKLPSNADLGALFSIVLFPRGGSLLGELFPKRTI